MISPVRLLTKKLFSASDEGFKIASRIAAQTRKCHGIRICSQVANVPARSSAVSWHADIVGRHMHAECAEPHESATPSGSN